MEHRRAPRCSSGAFHCERGLPLPLLEDLADLGRVADARDVEPPLGDHLAQRPQDRPRGQHRRGDPHAPPRRPDPLGDPLRELRPAPGAEPRPHAASPTARRSCAKPSRSSTLPARPQLVEVARVGGRQLGRLDRRQHVLRALPGVERPVRSSRSTPPRRRAPTYLWCMRSRQPGIGCSGTPSCSSSVGSVRGGGGSNGRGSGSGSSWLNMIRTRTPRSRAARSASPTASPTGAGQPQVVEGQVQRLPGRAEPGDEIARDILGPLASLDERSDPHGGRGSITSPAARLQVRLVRSEFRS